jgi:hypothetical protein
VKHVRFLRLVALAGLLGAPAYVAAQTAPSAPLASPDGQAAQVKAVMIDSSTAPLAATPRIVISSVMVSFQASQGGEQTNTSELFAAKTYASSALHMPEMDNAHLVKATYWVTLGSATASVDRFSGTSHLKQPGTAFARVGLMAAQSRTAFRSPSANTKSESAPGGYASNLGTKAKRSLFGALLEGSLVTGADSQFTFTGSITNPGAYRAEVVGLVKAA